ncbi:hypothetical protein [Myceligenerans crystallogenes]|uniref:Helix-turn-helix domain-containing protein n=1 Tax=Myceligenerans crystallogenes TaxID=316335 RepID=A0ABP4ZYP1_9MICO
MTGDISQDGRPTESQRMTGSELQLARLYLGMSRPDLARVLSCREDTVRRWEIGKDPVSFRVRDTLTAAENAADEAVEKLVAALQGMSAPRVVLDEEHERQRRDWPGHAVYGPGWWRAVVGRAARQVPGTRIGTKAEFQRIDTAEH